ncbi:RNA polymerase sigma factor, partial [human gut metagenome]
MRRKSHVRCEVGEKLEITSKVYLSLLVDISEIINNGKSDQYKDLDLYKA